MLMDRMTSGTDMWNWTGRRWAWWGVGLAAVVLLLMAPGASAANAFPDAAGFGTETYGGMPTDEESTRVLRVTSLGPRGRGSLKAALDTEGRRLIVFEVGGVIDLGGPDGVGRLRVRHPNVTIAGETAPDPGITIIRGDLVIDTHDVVVRHLRVRPGDAGVRPTRKAEWDQEGPVWEPGGIATGSDSYNVVIDHCSVTWGVRENIRTGADPNANPDSSHDCTVSNTICAEALHEASHSEGPHSRGMMVMDGNRNISHIGNILSCNVDANPKVIAAELVFVNNLVQNFGMGHAMGAQQTGRDGQDEVMKSKITAMGNMVKPGSGAEHENVFLRHVKTRRGRPRKEKPTVASLKRNRLVKSGEGKLDLLPFGGGGVQKHRGDEPILWPEGLEWVHPKDLEDHLLTNCGARPWSRDAIDFRIVQQALRNAGAFIDSQDAVGGYPEHEPTRRELAVPGEQGKLAEWLAGFEPEAAAPTIVETVASHDATIRGGEDTDTERVGTERALTVEGSEDEDGRSKVYLRFDLPEDLGEVVHAALVIRSAVTYTGPRSYEIHGLMEADNYGAGRLGEAWDELAIHRDNAPGNLNAPGLDEERTVLVSRFSLPENKGNAIAAGNTMSEFVRADTNGTVTFIVLAPEDNRKRAIFYSRHMDEDPPTLIVRTRAAGAK